MVCGLVCVTEGPIKGLAVTDAGSLSCKHILHLVAPSSKKDWCKLIKAGLQEAEDMGLASLAMPALGTGAARASIRNLYLCNLRSPSSLLFG